MCGIVGYIGDRDCADVLVNSLEKLEYRGYDSAGIAVLENGVIKVEKCKGRLENLRNKMAADGKPYGHVVSVIHAGQHMENHLILIHIHMVINV